MLMLAMMTLAVVTSGQAQEPSAAAGQQAPPPATTVAVGGQAQDVAPTLLPAPQEKQLMTVPAGTKISLTLASPIKPKAARPGDSVRAITAFPVTVKDQVAIPEGVLVEGVVQKLVKKDRWGHPWVEVHFTRMVFPNGYVLPLEAESTEARADDGGDFESASAVAEGRKHENGPSAAEAFEFQFPPQQPPTLPPSPSPNYAPAIALGVSGAAAAVAIFVIASRHRYDDFFYDAGWQFDMVLQSPLRVDAASWSTDAGN